MTNKLVYIGLLTAVASILFSVESLVTPLPWLRIGLANVCTVLALIWWGLKEGLLVTLLRVVIGSLISGRILQPVFFMALGGGIVATLGMSLLLRSPKLFSILGVSIAGAFLKNITQLALAGFIFIQTNSIFSLLPLFMLSSIPAGVIVGIVAMWTVKKLDFLQLSHRYVEGGVN